eukprot:scaffold94167_cov75-Phaeocystis_antarctica.AAC.2
MRGNLSSVTSFHNISSCAGPRMAARHALHVLSMRMRPGPEQSCTATWTMRSAGSWSKDAPRTAAGSIGLELEMALTAGARTLDPL